MPVNHNEMIEEPEGQIRKCGGAWEEWCVGTAKDSRGPFFQRHRQADLGDGLTYREAYTTTAAQAVVDHLLNTRSLTIDSDAVPDPGKIVFVYRRVGARPSLPQSAPTQQETRVDTPVFRRSAA